MPKPNSITVKVVKSAEGEPTSSQAVKFPLVAKDIPNATKIESLHPKVKMEVDAKTHKTVESVKVEPKAILIPKEDGTFEIQLTCSCGETHTIQCESVS